MAEQKSRSPYQRYGKTPFQYSPAYRSWKSAVKAGRKDEAEHFGALHTHQFGPPAWRRAEREATAAA